jgi:hypothetical protein
MVRGTCGSGWTSLPQRTSSRIHPQPDEVIELFRPVSWAHFLPESTVKARLGSVQREVIPSSGFYGFDHGRNTTGDIGADSVFRRLDACFRDHTSHIEEQLAAAASPKMLPFRLTWIRVIAELQWSRSLRDSAQVLS